MDDRYASWGVVLDNPNNDFVARDVTVTASFRGADGNTVGSPEVEHIPALRPGKSGWARQQDPDVLSTGGFAYMVNAAEPNELDVQVNVGQWVPVGSVAKGGVDVSDVKLVSAPGQVPSETVTGSAQSSFSSTQPNSATVAIFRDGGRIVGGARSSAEIPPGGPTTIRVADRERLKASSADLYVVPPA